jgi:hypothetical protein
VLGDGVYDVQVRAVWRRDGGLCAAHWRVWPSLESPPLPTAILLHDLLGAHRSRLDEGVPQGNEGLRRLGHRVRPAFGRAGRRAAEHDTVR